jgi:peptide/nickel transport system permease protein
MKGARFDQLRTFWNEFKRVKSGLVGIALLAFFLLIVVLAPVLTPFHEANIKWRDISYWRDGARYARPVWVNWFTTKKYAVSEKIPLKTTAEADKGSMRILSMEATYDFKAARVPTDLTLRLGITGRASLQLTLTRPDGQTITTSLSSGVDGSQVMRLSAVDTMGDKIYAMGAKTEDPAVAQRRNPKTIDAIAVLFGQAQRGIFSNPKALNGEYKMSLQIALVTPESRIDSADLMIAGGVEGILGTDGQRRDLWTGFVDGTKWALIIGLVTSFIAVFVGVVYGVAAGYFGGWIDSILNRIYEVFSSIPLLPILIVMSAVFKPSIWTMIIMMCVFFWVGPVKTVRSIAMQIRENSYIEAARGLGASHARILFRHMVPQLIPYSFASMALAVPGAIVYEATVSLLGLGDATIVSWGQILSDAISSGAVLQGVWWWVVPPGLAIALMGMTFAFIGFAMDTILNPRLKTR